MVRSPRGIIKPANVPANATGIKEIKLIIQYGIKPNFIPTIYLYKYSVFLKNNIITQIKLFIIAKRPPKMIIPYPIGPKCIPKNIEDEIT
jgi:hypothetical protein